MPLWLQGIIEACAVAFFTMAICLVMFGGMWVTGAWSELDILGLGGLSTVVWFAAQGVPVEFSVITSPETAEAAAEVATGTWWFVPWGATLIFLLLSGRAGKRLARATTPKKLWAPVAPAVLSYALFCGGLVVLITTEDAMARVNPALAVLFPVLVFSLGMTIGILRYYRPWHGSWGAAWGKKKASFSQNTRWTLAYLMAILRTGVIGLLGAWALAAILATIHIYMDWAPITEVYQRLGSGVWGGVVLTFVQLLAIPNITAWVLSWTSGVGFSLGTGSIIAPSGASVGAQPGIPLLAAIPTDATLAHHWWVMLLPVAAGIIAGWWFFREAENHLEEWIHTKIHHKIWGPAVATLVTGLIIGFVTMLLAALVFWLSGGTWGLGKFTVIGPHPIWLAAIALGGEVALGAMIGYLASPLVERPIYSGGHDEEAEEDAKN